MVAPGPGTGSVLVLFRRIEETFHEHTVHCPFVRGGNKGSVAATDDEARPFWQNELRHLECGLAGMDEGGDNLATVLEQHFDARCMGIGILRDRNRLEQMAQQYVGQLHAALHDEPDAEMPEATDNSVLKRTNATPSVQQPLEVEDVFDPEAEYRLNLYRGQDNDDTDIAFTV